MNGEVRDLREVIREEMLRREEIFEILKESPKTVPEVAEILGCPSSEVMLWVMGLRKYGSLVETGEVTDDGYYRYKMTDPKK